MSIEGLPARRELPDDVRDRLRANLREGIAKPPRKTHVWYAAAAAVLVLAAGAVVVTRQLRPPADTAPALTGGLTLDAGLATASLDRCWAAVRAAGKTDRVPPRAEWVPLFTAEQEGDAVVAATAAGKPMFCETTGTTVTLSDPGATPSYAPGTRTGLLLRSATGLAAGVLDPAVPRADFAVKTGGGSASSWRLRFSPVSRQFAEFTGALPAKAELAVGDGRMNTLPDAPAPLLAVTDRPEPADRTSAAGRALGDCLTDAGEVIPDAAAYRPGPLVKEGDYQVVMGRRGDRVIVCTLEPDYWRPGTNARAYPDLAGNRQVPARVLRVDTLGSPEAGAAPGRARMPLAVVLPASATSAGFEFGNGDGADAVVTDGMALAWVPRGYAGKVHIRAFDAAEKVVYDGTLPLG
ncbi:hypothetical protein VA596_22125 [Amycolatopsis sp., V23-08]|uniref:Type VII secretion protein EccB n=1 Tax=Amycolatopsis heterodermiae TaxID=3110235 RepID=A0ABU5R7P6_9PSEU|nr:hypothetical protein [Amycolatopsis sp., V23-08]MEA5362250.1 hypothetical protein [Amycolatopsis sp., V23-08]